MSKNKSILVQLDSLGSLGMITDIAPQALPPNAFTFANNVRFFNGAVLNVYYPSVTMNTVTKPDFTGKTVGGLIGDVQGDIYYGTNEGEFYQFSNSAHNDVSPTGSTFVDSIWESFNFNNSIVMHSPINPPQIKTPSASNFIEMPGWDADWSCKGLVNYKNFIFALNTTENSVNYKQRIRWSDAAPPNAAPISWDAGDTTKLAGFNDLTDATSEIITAKTLNDVLYVYTENEIFAVQYTGGSDLFNFRKVNSEISVLNSNSVCAYKNIHIILSRDNVYSFTGGNATSIINDKVRDYFFESINLEHINKIKVITNYRYNEIWICYPDKNSGGPLNRAAVLNAETGAWSFRDINGLQDIVTCRRPSVDSRTWDTSTYPWKDASKPWLYRDYGGDIILATIDGDFVVMDDSDSDDYQTGNVAVIERLYMDLDDYGVSSSAIKNFRTLFPSFEGQGQLFIAIGFSHVVGGTVSWTDIKSFNILTDTRLDFRASGRYMSLRIYSTPDTNTFWKFASTEMLFEQRFKGRARI